MATEGYRSENAIRARARHGRLLRNLLMSACRSIYRSLLRSSLTALSLVIGVAAVIAMVGIGNGAKARVQESIAVLDLNRLFMSARLNKGDGTVQTRFKNGGGITLEDYHAIKDEISGLSAISPTVEAPAQANARGRSSGVRVVGMDVDGFRLESRKVLRGAIFGSGDVRRAASVCVITESVVQALFKDSDPVGAILQVAGAPFRIIGVVGDKMSVTEIGDLMSEKTRVLVPFTSMLQRIDRNAGDGVKMLMRAESPELLPILKQQVSDLMERRRGKRKAEFAILTTADIAATYTTSASTLALLLVLIAAISLLVGGVGIMNVMLMSVKERTREIGVRMAIGARERDVLIQMLFEAVILSLLGGIIGIALGVGTAGIVSRWNEWPLLITPTTIVGAFLLSACVGMFFGYYPALRAAKLKPIEALRSD